MGTFRITSPFSVNPSARGNSANPNIVGWVNNTSPVGVATDAQLIAAVNSYGQLFFNGGNNTSNVGGEISFSGSVGAKTIKLNEDPITLVGDPANLIDFIGLPAGFRLLSARLIFQDVRIFGEFYNVSATFGWNLTISWGSNASINFNGTQGFFDTGGNQVALGEIILDLNMVTLPAPTMFDLLSLDFAINIDINLTSNHPSASTGLSAEFLGTTSPLYSPIVFEGTYAIESYSWSLRTPNKVVETGDIIPIKYVPPVTVPVTSPDTPPIFADSLKNITSVIIQYLDLLGNLITVTLLTPVFIEWTDILLTFPIPDLTIDTPPIIFISVTGTQFSGSRLLGSLFTVYANVSGIYTLVKGKTSDSLYVRDYGSLEVKIPNPTAKLGFVGSE